jgi:hypothetical protein
LFDLVKIITTILCLSSTQIVTFEPGAFHQWAPEIMSIRFVNTGTRSRLSALEEWALQHERWIATLEAKQLPFPQLSEKFLLTHAYFPRPIPQVKTTLPEIRAFRS